MADSADPTEEQSKELLGFLLSPASSTEKKVDSSNKPPVCMEEQQVNDLLIKHVPGVEFMLDRCGETPVSYFIWMTYMHGLPIYRGNLPVQQHTIDGIRAIFQYAATDHPLGPMALKRLAEAYQSCQAEQGRTIDSLYGKISGRDATLQDQVLTLVDDYKALTMEGVVNHLNPDAAGMDDDYPSRQIPHITSAYLEAVGKELGMRGVDAATSDMNRPQVTDLHLRAKILDAFKAHFSLKDLLGAIVSDVNQQAADAERVIDRELLMKWSASAGADGTFDAHSIFYDAERSNDYDGAPKEENMYQPFLTHKVVSRILVRLWPDFIKKAPAATPEQQTEPKKEADKSLALKSPGIPITLLLLSFCVAAASALLLRRFNRLAGWSMGS